MTGLRLAEVILIISNQWKKEGQGHFRQGVYNHSDRRGTSLGFKVFGKLIWFKIRRRVISCSTRSS